MNHDKTVTLKGFQYIVRCMELLGVTDLFAYPGGAVLPLYDALHDSPINDVLVRHEQAAALMANGYARVQNTVGWCLATSGPGATNLITGIADSYADNVPIIAITGQVPTNLIGTDAFQECDITIMAMPVTKRTYLLTRAADAQKVLLEAYSTAINGRPGPVLVDIPKDVQNQDVTLPHDWESAFTIPQKTRLWKAKPGRMEATEKLLFQAKKPLIMAGHGVVLSDANTALTQFAERENIPVISTILGRDAMAWDHPLYFSWLGMHGMKYANLAVQEADVIVAIGMRFDDRITGKLDEFAPNAKVIHVDIDRSEKGKNVYADVFVHGDAGLFFEHIKPTTSPANQAFREKWVAHLNDLAAQFPLKKPDLTKCTEITAITLLDQQISRDAAVSTDVGQHQMWSAQYLTNLRPGRFLTSAGLGTMGYGLPAAMGAQAALPTTECWAICGDGSFQMNLQELITNVQEGWPVKILVLDNSYLGMVRQWQEKFFDKRYSGVNLMNPDFAKLAEACYIKAWTATTPEEIKTAITEARAHDGPALIHAKVEKEEAVYPMVPTGVSLSNTIYYPDAA